MIFVRVPHVGTDHDALWADETFQVGDPLRASRVRHLDGSPMEAGDPVRCDVCLKPVRMRVSNGVIEAVEVLS